MIPDNEKLILGGTYGYDQYPNSDCLHILEAYNEVTGYCVFRFVSSLGKKGHSENVTEGYIRKIMHNKTAISAI